MGRSPCCDHHEKNVKKGPWTPEEDQKLIEYVNNNGPGSWQALPSLAGLNRCGKSCRLRWTNYLRPDIRRGNFSDHEEKLIINLHAVLGNKWSKIASHLKGRTDNEIKNYWNTHIRKKLLRSGIDPITHKPRTDPLSNLSQLISALGNPFCSLPSFDTTTLLKLQADAAKIQLFQNLMLQIASTNNNAYVPQTADFNSLQKNSLSVTNEFQSVSNDVMMTTNPGSSAGFSDTTEINTTSGYELPALVSVSANNDDYSMNQMESDETYMAAMASSFPSIEPSQSCKTDPKLYISPDASESSIFHDLEKLLDDETDDNCWKSFLESSTDAW